METGASQAVPVSVRKLQTAFQAKAKQNPEFRFCTLSDKVWREDVLKAAWQVVRRKGGSAGVDGETVAAIEARGVGKWLGKLARDWQTDADRPQAVRQEPSAELAGEADSQQDGAAEEVATEPEAAEGEQPAADEGSSQ